MVTGTELEDSIRRQRREVNDTGTPMRPDLKSPANQPRVAFSCHVGVTNVEFNVKSLDLMWGGILLQ